MRESELRSMVIKSLFLAAVVATAAMPFTAMSADRTVLGELFTIPG